MKNSAPYARGVSLRKSGAGLPSGNLVGAIAAACCAALLSVPTSSRAQQSSSDIRVYAAPSDIPCDVAREYMAKLKGTEDPAEIDIYTMRDRQCLTKVYNQANPSDPVVVVASYDPGEKKVLFNTIKAKQASDVAVGCKIVVAVSTANAFSDDPLTGALAGAAGKYSCDAYLQAALTSDPLLILLPTLIPSIELTKDVWRETRDFSAKVTNATGGNVPGTNIPIYLISPSAAVAMAAGKPVERAVQDVGDTAAKAARDAANAAEKAANDAKREAERAARNVARCVSRPWNC